MSATPIEKDRHPYRIDTTENATMGGCYDLRLMVGNLTKKEAAALADALAEWIDDDAWKARVQ